MIITKLDRKNNQYELFVGDLESFLCSENFVLTHDLYEGKELIDTTFDELNSLANLDRIKQKAKDYCSTRLLCKSKLSSYIQKIAKRSELKISKEQIQEILNEFEEYNLVNDYEYTRKIVDNLTSKKKGLGFIKQKLNTLGIDKEIMRKVITENFDNDQEISNLKSVLEKKKSSLEKRFEGDKLKQKLISFAMGKGYSFQDIKATLNHDSQD